MKIPCTLVFFLLLAACHHPPGKQYDPEKSTAQLYFKIKQNANKNPSLAAQADTIYSQTEKTLALIEQIRKSLPKTHSGEINTAAAARFLAESPIGVRLRTEIMKTVALCQPLPSATIHDSTLNQNLEWLREMSVPKYWQDLEVFDLQSKMIDLQLDGVKTELLIAVISMLNDIDDHF